MTPAAITACILAVILILSIGIHFATPTHQDLHQQIIRLSNENDELRKRLEDLGA